MTPEEFVAEFARAEAMRLLKNGVEIAMLAAAVGATMHGIAIGLNLMAYDQTVAEGVLADMEVVSPTPSELTTERRDEIVEIRVGAEVKPDDSPKEE